jgi:hypothetical protein
LIWNSCDSQLFVIAEIAKENLWDELEDLAWKYFSTEFEDESPEEVAQLLWSESRDYLTGNRDKIRSFVECQLKSPSPCVKLNPQSSDDTDDEVEEKMVVTLRKRALIDTGSIIICEYFCLQDTDSVETVKKGPDEDGWEVVTCKRKK